MLLHQQQYKDICMWRDRVRLSPHSAHIRQGDSQSAVRSLPRLRSEGVGTRLQSRRSPRGRRPKVPRPKTLSRIYYSWLRVPLELTRRRRPASLEYPRASSCTQPMTCCTGKTKGHSLLSIQLHIGSSRFRMWRPGLIPLNTMF